MTAWLLSRCSTELLILNLQPSHETSLFALSLTDYNRTTVDFASQYINSPPVAHDHRPHPYPDPSIREEIAASLAPRVASPCLNQDTIPALSLQNPVGPSNSSSSAHGPYLVAGQEDELQKMAGTTTDLVERPAFACDDCGKAFKSLYLLR